MHGKVSKFRMWTVKDKINLKIHVCRSLLFLINQAVDQSPCSDFGFPIWDKGSCIFFLCLWDGFYYCSFLYCSFFVELCVRTLWGFSHLALLNSYCCVWWVLSGEKRELFLCFCYVHVCTILTLVLLNSDTPCLCKQCRSRSIGFWRSQLIWICTVCH